MLKSRKLEYYRALVGTLNMKKMLNIYFPDLKVDLSERLSRPYIDDICKNSTNQIIKSIEERVYIRTHDLSYNLVKRFKSKNIEVFGTSSFYKRSIENSEKILKKAISSGANGIIISPVNKILYENSLHNG